jgi:hypothetical protein
VGIVAEDDGPIVDIHGIAVVEIADFAASSVRMAVDDKLGENVEDAVKPALVSHVEDGHEEMVVIPSLRPVLRCVLNFDGSSHQDGGVDVHPVMEAPEDGYEVVESLVKSLKILKVEGFGLDGSEG